MRTPRTLVKIAYNICATNEYLKNQLNHIRKVSDASNQYPIWAINVSCEIKQPTKTKAREPQITKRQFT